MTLLLIAGRMTKIKQAADCATAAGLVATFGYDALGRRITRTANNGAPAVTTSTTAYDSASRLATLAHNLDGAGAANDNTYSFAYNPASQVASRATANDTVYAWTNHYNVTRAYVSNGLNQYTASGPRTLGYDANPALSDAAGGVEGGNLTSDNIWTYGYDAENRLTSASGPQAVTLHYDAQGRLYKTIGATTTLFLYDGDALVAEYSGTGALLRRYVHGPGVDEPVLWYEGTGSATRRFFHADAQGSVVAVSDAAGLASEIHSYGPYGEPEGVTGSRFRYTGQIILPELGLYHYKARAYSPWLGRFLQTDPIGYSDDNNLYAYTGNDPGNKSDPTGEESYLVGRPVSGTGSNHMFVVVTDDKTGKVIQRFSYGPETGNVLIPGHLVSVTGSGNSTDLTDAKAFSQYQNNTEAAGKAGISVVTINASDSATLKSGNATDKILGTPSSPGHTNYVALPSVFSKSNAANSNSAAYKVADGAVKSENLASSQERPDGNNPGWGQSGNISEKETPWWKW